MKVLYKIGGIIFLCVMYISRRGKEGLRIMRKRHKKFWISYMLHSKCWEMFNKYQKFYMLCLIVWGGNKENFKFLMCNTINVWGKGLQIEPIIFYVILLSVGVKWFK